MGYSALDEGYENPSGLGVIYKMGVDYMIGKHFGIGVEMNTLRMFLRKSADWNEIAGRNDVSGITQAGILGGIRWYF